jgi:hypothetical protein
VVCDYPEDGGADHAESVPHHGNIVQGGGLEGGKAVRTALMVSVFGVPAALVIGHWCLRHLGTRGIETRLDVLHRQVMAWQAAHDHQVESIDRRMRDVEASAARAENEARIVSVQMADMTESLAGRIEQVEQRIELDVITGRYQPPTPIGARP